MIKDAPAPSRRRPAGALGFALSLVFCSPAPASPVSVWRTPDPSALLVIDTTRGRILIELQPALAPRAVERLRVLARRGFYDGLLFHRVIDGFVDQTGNPDNHDGGASELPNLPPEFDQELKAEAVVPASRPAGAVLGFLGSLPVARSAIPGASGGFRTWGLYCAGVMGMGRQAQPDTANSEIFFMRAADQRLDHEYAAVGRVLVGQAVVEAIAPGVPPPHPDRMIRVRIAADLPGSERPQVAVLDERGAPFAKTLRAARIRLGADFSPCAVPPVVRPAPQKDPPRD